MEIWYHFKHGWWPEFTATSSQIDSSIHDKCKPLAKFRVINVGNGPSPFPFYMNLHWLIHAVTHLIDWGNKVTVSTVSSEFIAKKVFYYSILSVVSIIEKLFPLSNTFQQLNLTISFLMQCSKETQIRRRLWSIPLLLPWKPDLFGFITSPITAGLPWE